MPTPSEPRVGLSTTTTQSENAAARAFVYRFLAKGFEYPDMEGWRWLCHPSTRQTLEQAVVEAFSGANGLAACCVSLVSRFSDEKFENFKDDHTLLFGHTVRGSCPAHETEYGDIKADPLFLPHRIADLGAFYRAFGLESVENAHERMDHISVECEFMAVLAAKEAYALSNRLEEDKLALCLDAQRKFLREHLGRWMPALSRRLSRANENGILGAMGDFGNPWIVSDCARANVPCGSGDMILRPVDETAETFAGPCGATNAAAGLCSTEVET
ncbi:MAG: molecular chaperone TorD family protein [Verrucomicrobia bacterium]|nr:molecular chaperone TorD family protein [Verrucomicrobiota bacterium]